MKRIQEINSEITNFVKELERELDKEFRNSAVFNIDSDQIRIYNSGSMNEDYKETILKVLNRF
jgi:hypothetical protein